MASWSCSNAPAEREILVYRFDGTSLVQDKAATMSFESRPGAIATGVSR